MTSAILFRTGGNVSAPFFVHITKSTLVITLLLQVILIKAQIKMLLEVVLMWTSRLDVGGNCTSLPVDVLTALEHLPFKDGAFDVLTCFHMLKHVPGPQMALDELVSVSRKVVHVKVPWRFSWTAKCNPTHLHVFYSSWFKQYAKLKGLTIAGKTQMDPEHCPRIGLCFPFAFEISAYLSKRRRCWYWKL